MTSRSVVIDRRREFATRQRLAIAARLADFERLSPKEACERIQQLAAAGVSDSEIARLIGWTVAMVSVCLEPPGPFKSGR
jgi:hypothetical protein